MKRWSVVVVVAGGLVAGSWIVALAQYGGAPVAQAQDAAGTQDKGVKTTALVSSTGRFAAALNLQIALSGQKVEIEPGGETARQRFLVPAFVYVIEGVLTSRSEGGPTGVSGIQYYGSGQAVVLPPPGTWFSFYNSGQTPVRYIAVFMAPPGATTVEKAGED